MKGVIFNVLEEVVSDECGAATWDSLIEAAGIEGAYTSLGSYPDADLFKLVKAASDALGVAPDDLMRWFGRRAVRRLADRAPEFGEGHESAKSFLMSVEQVIHVEVTKLYPDAHVPTFQYEDPGPGRLTMYYSSPRRLCALVAGMIEGAAEMFGETATIAHGPCQREGEQRCTFECAFKPAIGSKAA